MTTELTIGKLAEAAGVNIETIRYYQRRGLLDEPPKPEAGHRRYAREHVKRVAFIKRAQGLGFTLDEVHDLMAQAAAGCCADTRALAARKRALIVEKMAALAAMHDALDRLIRQCDAGNDPLACPLIERLAQE